MTNTLINRQRKIERLMHDVYVVPDAILIELEAIVDKNARQEERMVSDSLAQSIEGLINNAGYFCLGCSSRMKEPNPNSTERIDDANKALKEYKARLSVELMHAKIPVIVAYSFGRNDKFGYSGIDRYSELLHKGLSNIGVQHDTYAYGNNGVLKRTLFTPSALRDYDIIHLTQPHGYEAFLGNRKAGKILTWHDSMILTRKSKTRLFNVFRGLMAYINADIVVFNSTQSYDELKTSIRKYWNDKKECHIIPLPIDDIWIKESIEKKIKREGFIYIGAIDYPHKNFIGLINCYNSICDSIPEIQKPPLHIFTSSSNAREIVDNASTEMHHYPIILHERANDREILRQLKKSIALLHLSMEEGYGLPIMESLAVGTPVITLKSARIPAEVAKWTMRTAHPEEDAIRLYNKPKLADAEAIGYAKSLNKENYAREMLKIYKGIE